MKRFYILTMVALLSACSASDSTGPKNANVSGSWGYTATNLTGSGLSCSISNVTMTVNQTGTTFSGSYSSGTLNCGTLGGGNFTGGTVVTGTVSGNGVSFNFDTQDWNNTGTISGTSMSGTATMRVVLTGGQPLILTGNFSAIKR